VLLVLGDVDVDEGFKLAERYFAAFRRATTRSRDIDEPHKSMSAAAL